MMTRTCFGLIIIFSVLCVFAQNSTDYLIVDAPIGAQPSSNVLRVTWSGTARPSFTQPDSGVLYFDRSPGGGQLSNYRYKVTAFWRDTATKIVQNNIYDPPTLAKPLPRRSIAFRPDDQQNMGPGVYYAIIALPRGDTLVSNEFPLLIENPSGVEVIGPVGQISALTPTFSWKSNAGVPYYHIILSDDEISLKKDANGSIDLSGVSIVWQAITPNSQIIYGAPDPSGTITADPPPLSPGQKYTWVVLNNYGNHMAYSSTKFDIPGNFTVTGQPLKKPVCVYPKNITLNSTNNKVVTFKLANLDTKANTYKIYAYTLQKYEGISAQVIVWQTEVVAAAGAETLSVNVNAASTFTTSNYSWKAIAVDDKGAGTASDTVSFNYDVPTGTIVVTTAEQISVLNGSEIKTIKNPVGLVQIKLEVLDGSMEAPLFLYTDLDGYLSRERPTGTYRVTAVTSEFESQPQTVVISKNSTAKIDLILIRPEATIYGKVLDRDSKTGVNLARVYGISDRNDTVSSNCDALGNFVLKCYGADWSIGADKAGYRSVLPSKVTVLSGQNYNFGMILIEKNPFTLSGVVKNSTGAALLGVKIQLLRNGIIIDEIPSTSQQGTFSFSIPSGTYSLMATKTGFTSYNKQVDLTSSKSMTITMEPGATLVNGYIFGKTRVGDRDVIGPIPSAKVIFIKIGTIDTISTVANSTYGDFSISLPGNQTYQVYSSANGFVPKAIPCTLLTQVKSTQSLNDTLRAFAMISGNIYCSDPGNVSVSLTNVVNGEASVSGKSNTTGYIELRNITDGKYWVRAGKDGFVLDSIAGPDTIVVSNGIASPFQISIYLKPGDKTVKWNIAENGFTGSIKVQSPLVKTISSTDSLKKSGAGLYVVTVDAANDSFVDLSYHRFIVPDGVVAHTDSISMAVRHTRKPSIIPLNGKIELTLRSTIKLDSAAVYYKDAQSVPFSMTNDINPKNDYVFSIMPPKDGSTMLYYFKAFVNGDIYGYDKEVYQVFVAADTSILTRIEVVPSTDDTLLLPAAYKGQFTFKGYYSSAFLPDTTIDPSSITWELINPQGCVLNKTNGLSVVVTTGAATSVPVLLTVTVDPVKTKVKNSNKATIAFRVNGNTLSALAVTRVDAGNPNPITTSATDRAEFKVTGFDKAGKSLDVSPVWSITPANAGNISSSGVFKPRKNFAGFVHVFADDNKLRGEYKSDGYTENGLCVKYLITSKNVADSVTNGQGCAVIIPPHAVDSGDIGLLKIEMSPLKNKLYRGSGNIKTVDSLAYSITETQNVAFKFNADSLKLVFDIPVELQKSSGSTQRIAIACWDDDSLKWDVLANSIIAKDGKSISAKLAHFSVYSLVLEKGSEGYLTVTPNPFSPFVWPRSVSPDQKRLGTCITFQIETSESFIHDAWLKIYNVTGELVWSLNILNINQFPYQVWWDGCMMEHEIVWSQTGNIISKPGTKMCRNGRYFAVLTARDSKNKERRYMKNIVLMK